jgi:hypothetical protein
MFCVHAREKAWSHLQPRVVSVHRLRVCAEEMVRALERTERYATLEIVETEQRYAVVSEGEPRRPSLAKRPNRLA